MATFSVSYYEEPDQKELVDIDYQCTYWCMVEALDKCNITIKQTDDIAGCCNTDDGESLSWGQSFGDETDYDVHCSVCGTLMWRGLTTLAENGEL